MVWAIWRGPDWGPQLRRKAFPCSVAFVPSCVGAFPCSLGLVFGFLTFPWVVQHGLSEDIRNMYKTIAFLHILKTNRKRMARQKRRRKTTFIKHRRKNTYFEHSLWALFGAHLGCSIFWCAQLRCFNGAPENVNNNLK
jgi:hypothetical protein